MEEYKKKWSKCLDIIRDNVGETAFAAWFSNTEAIGYSVENNRLKLSIPSDAFFDQYEGPYYDLISGTLRRVFGADVRVNYEIPVIMDDDKARVSKPSQHQSPAIKNRFMQSLIGAVPSSGGRSEEIDSQLNASLNFENYCVGDSNRLPFTIAEYIANNPHKTEFNPFFLYGEVGVGKTHLIQAIGLRIKEKNPSARVLFTTLKQFQNLYANAAINRKIPGFINWFQQVDVLLIDDLQELSSKIKTADDALFPIFNYLHQNGKQLVFTCDRPPVELDGIADRLIDRFKWGITEKLPRPDLTLRKRILQFKAAKNGLSIPEEVIDYVAECATGSVRELEGIVMGILTRSITLNAPISLSLARDVMAHHLKKVERKTVNFDMIIEATAEYYRLTPDVIFSKSRVRDISDARQVVMYLCHKLTSLSAGAIGQKLNRSHATVLHGIAAIKDRIDLVKGLSDAVGVIEEELQR
ncbi:MAG: chromosomal replication initiator protein DnaA [Bacteroidales bacterium]|nr:chromosomal replication initiator protein DnaA [Bacteroidales bacterium]